MIDKMRWIAKTKRVMLYALMLTTLCAICFGCTADEADERGYEQGAITINIGGTYTDVIGQTIMLNDLLTPLLPPDVTVEWRYMENGAAIRDAMLTGSMDIGSISVAVMISAIENDLPLQILSAHVPMYGKIVSTKPQIQSITDLSSDSRITVSAIGNTPHLSFALRCRDALGDAVIFDNQIVPVPNADAIGLMQSAQEYDAYVLTFPACFKIPDGVEYHVVDDLTDTATKYNVGMYIVSSQEFIKKNPVIISAFRAASEQAVELLNNKTNDAAVLLSEFYGVDAETVASVIRQTPPKLEVVGYDEIADLMYEMGILTNPPKKFSSLPYYAEIPKE